MVNVDGASVAHVEKDPNNVCCFSPGKKKEKLLFFVVLTNVVRGDKDKMINF